MELLHTSLYVNSSVGETVQLNFHLRQNAFVSYVFVISCTAREGRSFLHTDVELRACSGPVVTLN